MGINYLSNGKKIPWEKISKNISFGIKIPKYCHGKKKSNFSCCGKKFPILKFGKKIKITELLENYPNHNVGKKIPITINFGKKIP